MLAYVGLMEPNRRGAPEILDREVKGMGTSMLGFYWDNGKNGNYRDYRDYIGIR